MKKRGVFKIVVLLICLTVIKIPAVQAANTSVSLVADGFEGADLWTVRSASVGAQYGIGSTARNGTKGYSITTSDYRGMELIRSFKAPADGREFCFSAYINAASLSENAGASLIIRSGGGAVFAESKAVISDTEGAWIKEELRLSITAEAGTDICFVLKWNSKGTVHFDDVSVSYAAGADEVLTTARPGGEELLPNPGLEEMTGWFISGTGAASNAAWYNGTQSVCLESENGKNSFVYCKLDTLLPGATYELRFRILATVYGTSQAIKMQYYTKTGSDLASFRIAEQTVGAWKEYRIVFSPPVGIQRTEILFRTYDEGVIYYDDLSLKKTADPVHAYFDLNEIYYYTDLTHGYARLDVNEEIYNSYADWYAQVTVEDAKGEELYEGEKVSLAEGKKDIPFPLSDIPVSEEARTVLCTIWKGAEILETQSAQFYRRFPRPSMLTEDGKLQKDGKPLSPVFGYHVTDGELDTAKELGINTILMSYDFAKDPDAMWAQLDFLQEEGFYGVACLYVDMKSGGSPENIEYTKTSVEKVRTHPALLGYAIMDEPIGNDCPEEEILAAYCAIRERDSIHPVYMTDMYPSYYRTLSKWTDLVAADHYPYSVEKSVYYTGEVLEHIEDLMQYSGKTTAAILQFFPYNNYYPTPDEMRNMLYQSFFSGADSIGYYALDYMVGGVPVEKTDVGNMLRAFAKEEQQILFDYFVHGKYTKLSEAETDSMEWVAFSDGEKTYFAVRNKALDTPLAIDVDSRIHQNAFVRIIGGAEKGTVEKKSNGIFGIEVPAGGAALYEFTNGTGKLVFCDGIYAVNQINPGTVSVTLSEADAGIQTAIALYAETEKGIKLITSEFSEGGGVSLTIPQTEGDERRILKAFAWKKGNLQPVAQSEILKGN